MEEQVNLHHRGGISGVDQTDEQQRIEASSLLDGFVQRSAQIEQQRPHLDHDQQHAKSIEEAATSQRFDKRGRPALDVGRHLAEASKPITPYVN